METSRSEPPRLLIANRGEIALRVIRGARDLGWTSIAVYSEADRAAPHVALADLAYPIGPAPAAQSYLNTPVLLEAARLGRATHLHPGYGFLSENAEFAQACDDAGLVFVGPPPEAIASMGDKVAARRAAEAASVPVVRGTPPLPADPEAALSAALKIGYPVLLKAAFGGGGKGMRLCAGPEELRQALPLARGEAGRAFGNDTLYLERALVRPRHIEIQILCDHHGRGVVLGERECSIQRRHQKLIEETPSVAVSPETRRQMGEAALRLALAIGYRNAGTVEFLLDSSGAFYFLEMNTRLQVEHTVTEMVTGIDIVRAQLQISLGLPLPWTQADIHPQGAALECRICAEDPANNFLPTSGRILGARLPQGPGVRNDSGFREGGEVSVHYDSLLAKLITWGSDREEARLRMLRALEEYSIEGIPTNLPFHRWALRHPAFIEGRTDTGFIAEHFRPDALVEPEEEETLAALALVAYFRERESVLPFPRREVSEGTADSRRGDDPWAPRQSAWKRASDWRAGR